MRVPCILVTGWLAEDANLLRAGPGQSLSAGKQGVDSPTGSLRPGSRENMPPRPLRGLGGEVLRFFPGLNADRSGEQGPLSLH